MPDTFCPCSHEKKFTENSHYMHSQALQAAGIRKIDLTGKICQPSCFELSMSTTGLTHRLFVNIQHETVPLFLITLIRKI